MVLEVSQSTPLLPDFMEIWQDTLHWQPTAVQREQFQQLYGLIIAGNCHMNLTRITKPTEFWEKHLWDSIRGIAFLLAPEVAKNSGLKNVVDFSGDRPLQGMDIGTGGGFPGIPISLALMPVYSQLNVTLLDATQKKITFLQDVVDRMNLSFLSPQVGRAEVIHRDPSFAGNYDFCLVRAVSKVGICVEYALPFLKPGGLAILYRGKWTAEEEKELQKATKKQGGQLEEIQEFQTPLTQSQRHCIYIKKMDKRN